MVISEGMNQWGIVLLLVDNFISTETMCWLSVIKCLSACSASLWRIGLLFVETLPRLHCDEHFVLLISCSWSSIVQRSSDEQDHLGQSFFILNIVNDKCRSCSLYRSSVIQRTFLPFFLHSLRKPSLTFSSSNVSSLLKIFVSRPFEMIGCKCSCSRHKQSVLDIWLISRFKVSQIFSIHNKRLEVRVHGWPFIQWRLIDHQWQAIASHYQSRLPITLFLFWLIELIILSFLFPLSLLVTYITRCISFTCHPSHPVPSPPCLSH